MEGKTFCDTLQQTNFDSEPMHSFPFQYSKLHVTPTPPTPQILGVPVLVPEFQSDPFL
jgi:hypothetical protein